MYSHTWCLIGESECWWLDKILAYHIYNSQLQMSKKDTERSNLFENRRARVWIWEVCLSLLDQECYVILLCLLCFCHCFCSQRREVKLTTALARVFLPANVIGGFFFFFSGRPRLDIPYTMARYMGLIYQQTLLLSVWKSSFLPSPYISEHCR